MRARWVVLGAVVAVGAGGYVSQTRPATATAEVRVATPVGAQDRAAALAGRARGVSAEVLPESVVVLVTATGDSARQAVQHAAGAARDVTSAVAGASVVVPARLQ